MSRRCELCGKEPHFGRSVSRLGKNAIKRRVKARALRRWDPNIQSVRANVDGTPTRLKICTSCLKKGSFLRQAKA